MSKVYYKKLTDFSDKKQINDFCYEILNKIVENENIKLESTVPLKVHFGERGNNTFITPDNYNGVKKFLKDNNIETFYVDTNVLYKGSRTKTDDHIQTALEHGFNDLPVVIADGDDNNSFVEIEINKKHFDKCKIGAKLTNYDNVIVLSHFKGHNLAGMGGAIKQLAMGFASRGGKLHQHSESIPYISKDKCITCGLCVNRCPVNAITLPDKAVIDPEVCIGCAACMVVCPVSAISTNWNGLNFYEKLAEYAYAASLNKTNIYFNFAFNITENCDCVGEDMSIIAPNIGILVSTDPVAVDNATLDLYESITGNENFSSARATIEYGNQIGLGSKVYTLIEL